jgi:2-amino-4-hydroxy-6-hydroxymethyldihydropteridine diphosphokinase
MNKVYLILGSNQQQPKKQLLIAQKYIADKIGLILRNSSLYQTAAWGNTQQSDFVNQIIIVQTKLTALQTLETILSIEEKMGRVRTKKNAPRIIDIDILFFNKAIINTKSLVVPHAEIINRKFVLIPLKELSPNFKHPLYNKTIHQLLPICTDKLAVHKIV